MNYLFQDVFTLHTIYGLEPDTWDHIKLQQKNLQLCYNQFKYYFLFLNRIAPTYSDP